MSHAKLEVVGLGIGLKPLLLSILSRTKDGPITLLLQEKKRNM